MLWLRYLPYAVRSHRKEQLTHLGAQLKRHIELFDRWTEAWKWWVGVHLAGDSKPSEVRKSMWEDVQLLRFRKHPVSRSALFEEKADEAGSEWAQRRPWMELRSRFFEGLVYSLRSSVFITERLTAQAPGIQQFPVGTLLALSFIKYDILAQKLYLTHYFFTQNK